MSRDRGEQEQDERGQVGAGTRVNEPEVGDEQGLGWGDEQGQATGKIRDMGRGSGGGVKFLGTLVSFYTKYIYIF